MSEILKVSGASKSFGGVVANHDISLVVPRGRIVGLIGPNGSGKTTLFSSIVGYHPIDRGSIAFDDREISRLCVPEIARLGFLRTFQQTRIYGKMNCVKNMEISASHVHDNVRDMFRPVSAATTDKAGGLLDFVGLYQKRFLQQGISPSANKNCSSLQWH